MNGAGIPSVATDTIPVVAVGTTTPVAARWATGAGTLLTAGAMTEASVLSAQQASKNEMWLCSTGVAQAASRSGAGT